MPQVYVPRIEDIVNERVQIQDEVYHVDATEDYLTQVPARLRKMCDWGLRSIATNGNGACGVHFVFGCPSGAPDRNLFAFAVRKLLARMLGPTLDVLTASGAPAMCVESVQNMLWNEYVLKHLSEEDDDESRCFWQTLEKEAPELATEARVARNAYTASVANQDTAKIKMVAAARKFFNLNIEENLV